MLIDVCCVEWEWFDEFSCVCLDGVGVDELIVCYCVVLVDFVEFKMLIGDFL